MTRTYRYWTHKEQERLVALRRSGLTVGACARRLGRSKATVAYKLHQLRAVAPWHGLRPKRKDGKLKEWVRRLCGKGLNDEEIAERLLVTRHTVRNARLRMGIPALAFRIPAAPTKTTPTGEA